MEPLSRVNETAQATTVPGGAYTLNGGVGAPMEPDGLVPAISGWAYLLGEPRAESARSRRMARFGGIVAVLSLVLYLIWRIFYTIPQDGGYNEIAAWTLVIFEALPLFGLTIRIITLWNIDSRAPEVVTNLPADFNVVVFIPTYNEPIEVIAPTIAASVALAPRHETWVLDDGDRPWVRELSEQYGARYVRRDEHTHAKAGNMNHAMDLMAQEAAAGGIDFDVIAVLDCDHVPLPTFLTTTLGWFDDPKVALVQAPQTYYNAGAFDDDGVSGEQGVFFHVQLPARNKDGAGPFWCGSTSLIRTSALREIGGIATETIVEDMHTTLGLIRAGWKTVYHHQVVAVGLAPATPEQYLLQRRRWGMGSMQVLAKEKLWGAKRWLSWRNYYEYLTGTLWWLEGVATILLLLIPMVILVTGAETSTADAKTFAVVFLAMFVVRLWGVKQLFRQHLQYATAFSLRIFRVPVGLACFWWLLTRRSLEFEVTPKSGADERIRGQAPKILTVLFASVVGVLLYAAAGTQDWVPWRASDAATVASASWLVIAALVLLMGIRRISSASFATSRRNAHRIAVQAPVILGGSPGTLVDISVGGAAVSMPIGALPEGDSLELELPGIDPVTLQLVRRTPNKQGGETISLKIANDDWSTMRTLSMWIFDTPPGSVPGLPASVPAAAVTQRGRVARRALAQLARERGAPG